MSKFVIKLSLGVLVCFMILILLINFVYLDRGTYQTITTKVINITQRVFQPEPLGRKVPEKRRENAIDVVYTWVNGTDPDFVRTLHLEVMKLEGNVVDKREQRFYDNQLMRFSMRSIEKFAPWIGNMYVVTNGQIPCWLNTSNPRVRVIFQKDIFEYQSHLPTFSSPAIETHLHKIPGLSEEFLYFNDDFLLGAPVFFSDFYTPKKGYKTYLSGGIPGLDKIEEKKFMQSAPNKANSDSIFFDSLLYSAYHFKHELNMKMTNMAGHVPHLINRSVMARLQKKLRDCFNHTSGHKFRHSDDIQVPSSYFAYLKGEGNPTEAAPGGHVKYFSLGNNWQANEASLKGLKPIKFYCMNDVIVYSVKDTAMLAAKKIRDFLKEKYPEPSSFEYHPEICL